MKGNLQSKLKRSLAGVITGVMAVAMVVPTGVATTVTVLAEETTYTYTVISPASVTLDYTGTVPDLNTVDEFATITISSRAKLTRGTDYTVQASSAGPDNAWAVFTMLSSSAYANDTIAPVPITFRPEQSTSSYQATVDTSKFVYDGNALSADEVAAATTVIKDGIENISKGTKDGTYAVEVTPINAVNAGSKVKVTITINGLTGDAAKIYEEEVTIAKANLKDLFLSGTYEALTYNGEAQNAAFSEIKYAFAANGAQTALSAADYTVDSFANNVNAGNEATATITAKSSSTNFTGSGTVKYTIDQFNLGSAHTQVQPASVVYNGSKQTPEFGLTVAFSNAFGAKVISADDYKITYPNESTNVGTYSVTIEPKTTTGNLTRSKTVQAYHITQASLKDNVTKTDKKAVPAGALSAGEAGAVVPASVLEYFTLKVGDYELTANDFTATLSGTANKKGETCTITITGKDNFKDTYSFTFVTAAKALAETYTSETDAISYDGTQKTPTASRLGELTVKGGTAKIDASDYDVVGYENNINAGTAIATIKGKGEYEGTAKVEFTINQKNLTKGASDVTAVTGIKEGGTYYVGAEVADATVTFGTGAAALTLDKDDVNVVVKAISENKVTKVTISFRGNYAGTAFEWELTNPVTVKVADLDNAVVTGEIPAGLSQYDENAIKRYIKVTVDGTEIGANGYTVSAITRVPAETTGAIGDLGSSISFTITGAEPVIGTKKNCSVNVVQRDIADLTADNITIDATTTYSYDGTEKRPEVTVGVTDTDAKDLTPGTDYEISYANNVNAGTATVTVKGIGNYKGSLTKDFTIGKKTLTTSDFKITGVDSVEYKTGAVDDLSSKLSLAKSAAESSLVFAASDYRIELVAGQTNVKVGNKVSYKVTILEGSQNYTADTFDNVEAYSVVQETLTDAVVTIEKPLVTWKTDQTVAAILEALGTITVKVGDKTLVKDTDYAISIEGVTNKVTSELTASDIKPAVVVEFQGDYAGKTKQAFTIVPVVINIKDVNLVAPTGAGAVYNGNEIAVTAKDGGKDNLVTGNNTNHYYVIVYKDADGKVLKDDAGNYIAPSTVGTYTATVVATATYGGEEGNSVTYTITPKNLSAIEFKGMVDSLKIGNVAYAGENTEAPILYDDEDHAIKNTEFEVLSYDKEWDGKDATKGKAVITLKADSNYAYAGNANVEYTWEKGQLSGTDLLNKYTIDAETYSGKALEPDVRSLDPEFSEDWVAVKYYENNVNASTKTAKAWVEISVPEDNAKYEGAAAGYIVFTINKAPISEQNITVAKATYTGKALEPAVTVKDVNGSLLDLDKDYTIDKYEDNVNAGTATVTITGIKNYTGTQPVTFTIAKAANPLKIAKAPRSAKVKTLKKKAVTVAGVKVSKKGQGAVTYKIAKVNTNKANFKINAKTGKITVKKGTKKGTYKVTVSAVAKGNANYAKSKTLKAVVTIKVK